VVGVYDTADGSYSVFLCCWDQRNIEYLLESEEPSRKMLLHSLGGNLEHHSETVAYVAVEKLIIDQLKLFDAWEQVFLRRGHHGWNVLEYLRE